MRADVKVETSSPIIDEVSSVSDKIKHKSQTCTKPHSRTTTDRHSNGHNYSCYNEPLETHLKKQLLSDRTACAPQIRV